MKLFRIIIASDEKQVTAPDYRKPNCTENNLASVTTAGFENYTEAHKFASSALETMVKAWPIRSLRIKCVSEARTPDDTE